MKAYDVIVIGSGAGMLVVEGAVLQGLEVALVDKGPLGGTCLNLGCIPSKMLIYPADRITEIQEATRFGIEAKITSIDFTAIAERMRETLRESREQMRDGIERTSNLDFYEAEGHFTEDYTMEVNGETTKGQKIFIASGVRPSIPPIKGIDKTAYLTNETVLDLKTRPESMIIVGGGYIAAEYGHFFAAMGTDVTLIQRRDRLVPTEETEVSELLRNEMAKRMTIATTTEVVEVQQHANGCTVIGKDRNTGEEKEFAAEKVMIAAGRKSNADLLAVERTGVKTDERGFITVNEYLETSKENIWALGDAIGKHMFRHVANQEALVAWHNSTQPKKVAMDYRVIPHAVFSHPQIASVGLTEEHAKKDHEILVGKAHYSEVAKGEAMMEEESFAKAIVDRDTRKILGFHIIGPYAPILIQEAINTMAHGHDFVALAHGMHIHPALPEVILATLRNLRAP
jgi:mycothione reductase